MKNRQLSELIGIINDTGDMLKGGWKKTHETVSFPSPRQSDSIETVAEEIRSCRKCGLCSTRMNPVPGEGVLRPRVMFIGEGPGADEDRTGRPFVGKAGQYLDKWLGAVDLERDKNCFIGNIIKCRPPENRDPLPGEIEACRPYLLRQLYLIRPEIIVTLGRFASQVICASDEGIGRLRGRVHSYQGIPVIPTYHPSAVLRNQDLRGDVWNDLKMIKQLPERK